jgi:endonuclease G
MGRIDIIEGLRAAERFKRAKSRQDALRDASGQSDAIMLDRRRTFMLASQSVLFESIIDGSDLLPIRYLEMGRLASRAVGRIHIPPTDGRGMGFATGFLIAPGLLMTNQHVLPSEAAARAASVTMDADDGIDGLPMTPRVFRLDSSRGYIADPTLDFAIVGMAPRATDGTPLAHYGYLRLQAMTGKIVRDEYATIIQHPNGRQKHIAARNNKVHVYIYDHDLPAEERAANAFLYYSTDTLRGSSGAPVFSDQWYVAALHRRGVPRTRRVEGAERMTTRMRSLPSKPMRAFASATSLHDSAIWPPTAR